MSKLRTEIITALPFKEVQMTRGFVKGVADTKGACHTRLVRRSEACQGTDRAMSNVGQRAWGKLRLAEAKIDPEIFDESRHRRKGKSSLVDPSYSSPH